MFKPGNAPWNKTNIDMEWAAAMYRKRVPVKEIAARYGVSETAIYQRLKKLGITRNNSESHKGIYARERNPNWKGGRHYDAQGYVVIRLPDGSVTREHRLIAAQMLGRPLLPGEIVHHKNGDKSDNRPDNLEILPSQAEHMREHMIPEEARRRGRRGNLMRYGKAALKAVEGGEG